MRIVLCYVTKPCHLEQIAAVMPEAEIVDASQEQIATEIFSADIFCGHAKVPIDWDGVVRQGRLQWIQSSAAGMDHCLVPSVIESKILVTSASGALADQVAEHTIALMTAWTRSLPTFFRAAEEGVHPPADSRSDPQHGRHRRPGRRGPAAVAAAQRFETRILAVDMFPVDKPDWVESLWPAERLDELLPLVDFLVLSVPLNPTTRGMIDAAAIAKMKPGAVLVNVARGPLVVESDLVAALESGHLAGRRDGRYRAGAAADLEQTLGPAPSDHHAARRRPGAPGETTRSPICSAGTSSAGNKGGR